MSQNSVSDGKGHRDRMDEGKLISIIKTFNLKKLQLYIKEELEKWKTVELKIAVTGRAGVGKSTLINALRGLSAEDDGAAKVGCKQTTTEVSQYPHPKNKNLILYDLPGVGTKDFSNVTYLSNERVGFRKFDIFLVVTADRFCEDDCLLTNAIKDKRGKFIFIRTKIHQDVENDKTAKPKHHKDPEKAKELVADIRNDCEENLQKYMTSNSSRQRVFLIDSYKTGMYDFDELTRKLIDGFSDLKRDALILSITSMTPEIVKAKIDLLGSQIWKRSFLSALGSILPFPGVSYNVNIENVKSATKDYQEQFGIDEMQLAEFAKCAGLSLETLKYKAGLKTIPMQCTRDDIIKLCSDLEFSVGSMLFRLIPVVGAYKSYQATNHSLEKILQMVVEDRERLMDFLEEQSS